MKTPKEQDILNACLQYLQLRGFLAWRQNSGAVVSVHQGRRRFVRFNGAPGCADILGIVGHLGTFLAVEIKRPGNKPTAKQLSFLDAVRRHGGMAIVADSVESLARQLGEAGI